MKRASPNLAVAAALLALSLACHSSSKQAQAVGDVFVNGFTDGIVPQLFQNATLDSMRVDTSEHHSGTSSIRFDVPATNWIGWAFPTTTARDLSGYNALTFWAKASKAATLNEVGFGDDNTGTHLYKVTRLNVPLTTAWTRYVLPIPLASKLTAEKGLFHMSEGSDEGAYTFWVDDVKFEKLADSELGAIRPSMTDESATIEVGATRAVSNPQVTAAVGGVDVVEGIDPQWFTYMSSNTAAATVSAAGAATGVAVGSANITATLGTTPVTGTLALTVGALHEPTAAAPTPTAASADVISLFSDAYTNVPVDTWSATWDHADVEDVQVAGNATKKYSNLAFAGIEFLGANSVDATQMTHFHVDVWSHGATLFKVKLVDAGADNTVGNGSTDDSEQELTFNASSSPAFTPDGWVSLDVPLSSFGGLTSRAHLSQLIISADNAATVWVDNVYFVKEAVVVPTAPTAAPPAPTAAAADVISLYTSSGTYTNVAVDTWGTSWSNGNQGPNLSDVPLTGGTVKKYANLDFVGVEFFASANEIDASQMTHFHASIWTANATTFRVKLVDYGADTTPGGGDDAEGEVAVTSPAQGSWVDVEIPLSSFATLTQRNHLAQLIFSALPTGAADVYVDNVYFVNKAVVAPTAPTATPAAPTAAPADVISLYTSSGTYTNVAVDTWGTSWSNGSQGPHLSDVALTGGTVKKYANLDFVGVEFFASANEIDATGMTAFHMSIWTPDATTFRVKLVDFGANTTPGGGDDTEAEVAVTSPAQGSWVEVEIPLSSFATLTHRDHLAQLIFSALPTGAATVFVDNVYFHK